MGFKERQGNTTMEIVVFGKCPVCGKSMDDKSEKGTEMRSFLLWSGMLEKKRRI